MCIGWRSMGMSTERGACTHTRAATTTPGVVYPARWTPSPEKLAPAPNQETWRTVLGSCYFLVDQSGRIDQPQRVLLRH